MNLQTILQLPFEQKCQQLAMYTDQCMLSALESVFPVIVSDIFGTDHPGGFNGWALCKHSNNLNSPNYVAAFNFLSPNNGTIFKIIYALLKDFNIKYCFPFKYLPLDIQKSIRYGNAPKFYMDKLALDPKTRQVLYLYLNPFQFYMFTFVKYLWDKEKFEENLEVQMNVDSLYQRLLTVYCNKFLPVSHNLPVEPNVYYSSSVTPALDTTSVSFPKNKSRLLKPHVLSVSPQSPKSPGSRFSSYSPLNVSGDALGSAALPSINMGEVWRSELLIHLFTDYWMQSDVSLPRGFSETSQQSRFSELYRQDVNSQQSSLWSVPVYPSGYQVRCIRFVIKHLHQFASSRLHDVSSLGQFRRAVLPLTQAKIHAFLEHHIAHWPHDASFKLILETWFSFIQPWRYSELTPPPGADDAGPTVDRTWINFIADNLATYTNLLHLVLDRFLRLDLNNVFNTHLVFRVAKVYNTPNLCPLIKEIEADLYHESLNNKYGGSPGWQVQRQSEQNPRLFSLETTKKIHQLMERIQASISHCQRELSSSAAPSLSFWSSFRAEISDLFNPHLRMSRTDENTRVNLTQTIRYLAQTLVWFEQIFNIPPPPPLVAPSPIASNLQGLPNCVASGSFMDRTVDNTLVTGDTTGNGHNQNPVTQNMDTNSFFMPKQLNVRDIKYDGDPDLMPMGSGEIVFLVQLFYRWSCRLNIALYDQIQDIYSRSSGVLPLLLRATLMPPCDFYRFERHADLHGLNHKTAVHLPARISLRAFASWPVLVKVAVYALVISLFLGVHWSLGVLCYLSLWLLCNLLKYLIFGV